MMTVQAPPPDPTKRIVLAISALTSFLPAFMLSSVNIALPSIQKVYGASAVWLSWVATSYLLSSGVFLVPSGKMGDIWGRKKILSVGLWVFILSSALGPMAPNIVIFLLLRAAQGAGGSLMLTMSMAILTSVFPAAERGKALGVNAASIYLGSSAGPFFGGLIISVLGWPSVFFLNGALSLAALVILKTRVPFEWREGSSRGFDMPGFVIYGTALVAVMYGASILPSAPGWVITGGGVALFSSFLRRMLRSEEPLFDVRLFSGNRIFAFSNAAALINYAATYSVSFLLSLYLQYIKALSPREAGLIMVTQPFLQAVLSPYAGRLSDRIEPGLLASGGMFSTASGLLILSFLGWNTPRILVYAALILLGVGFAFFSSPNTNAIMSSVPARFYGAASGSVGTMRVLGQMGSMTLITIIFSVYIGGEQITSERYADFLSAVRISFTISSAVCFAGVFFSWFRGNLHEGRDGEIFAEEESVR
ncbi:MAG: MFS transporter [Aminivibrio sp.]